MKNIFCQCVDDFGVKYFSKDDADHYLDFLKNHYAMSKIGRVVISSDWKNIGVATKVMWIYWYQNMWKNCFSWYIIPIKNDQNMPHNSGQYLLTKNDSRWHHIPMKLTFLKKKPPSRFNQLLAPFHIISNHLIQQGYDQPMKFQDYSKNQKRTLTS